MDAVIDTVLAGEAERRMPVLSVAPTVAWAAGAIANLVAVESSAV